MRGIYTNSTKIRRRIFAEIAKIGFEKQPLSSIEDLPYKIIKGEFGSYRDSVFLERAIVGERIRLALGMPLVRIDENIRISQGIEECAVPERYYEAPLVNVIGFACNGCEETGYKVSDLCRGCLAHPCKSICPVGAVSMVKGKSIIDNDKCINCGRCKEVCPYSAIIKHERPCSSACGVNAIESDEHGRARINQEKCVNCGMCLVNCPFSAIVDKSQIYQLILAINQGDEIVAEIAPAFVGQFGTLVTPKNIKGIFKQMGFSDVVEVAQGADDGAVEEAHHYLHEVPEKQAFLATSCCPSWSVLAKRELGEMSNCVSLGFTPMVNTARKIKEKNPNAKVVFIGPCSAKKLEAARRTVKSHVDFVITFEELAGMMAAKDIDFDDVSCEPLEGATRSGRGFGNAGGVVSAICDCIKVIDPDREVPTDRAEGLANCKKMLALAKAGKRNGYIIEGMACPGGCVGGAGTLLPVSKASVEVQKHANSSKEKVPNVHIEK